MQEGMKYNGKHKFRWVNPNAYCFLNAVKNDFMWFQIHAECKYIKTVTPV